jgi:DNA-binding CsgD family transcriptional regulator
VGQQLDSNWESNHTLRERFSHSTDEVTSAKAFTFIGRSSDRERLATVLAQLHAGLSAVLVISGDPGIGKTHLLHQMVEDAADIQTVMVSGYEAEARLGFAALHRLVLPFLGGLSELPEPQREALAVAFGLTHGAPPNRFLVGLATMALLEQTAQEQQLLCVVDDVQWVDQETIDALTFVARRLDAEGIGLIFGLRIEERDFPDLAGVAQHRLARMSNEDMTSLLLVAAPTPPAPFVATRLVRESEGNPLALLEYLSSLTPERLAGSDALPDALPISERLTARFAAQVERLPRATQQMLLVISAGTNDAGAVSNACARLQISLDAALPAIQQSIISAEPDLAFRHPLIRSVVYETAAIADKRRVHNALADVADDRGAPDTAAWHRAHATAGPDETVAMQLELAALRIRDRGGYAAEATYLTMAAQHSFDGTADHSRRLLAAAHAHVIAGNSDQAELLLDGCNFAGSVAKHIQIERVRALMLNYDSRTADSAAVLVTAALELSANELDLARQLLFSALRAAMGSRQYTLGTTLPDVARALLSRPRAPGHAPTAVDLIYEGLASRCLNPYQGAAAVLKQALGQLTQDPESATALLLLTWLVAEDLLDDEFETVTLTQLTESNREQGALPSVWIGLAALANTETRHGNFETAEAMFDEATAIAVAVGGNCEVVWPTLVELRAWQGREMETRSIAGTLVLDWGQTRRMGSSANFGLLGLTVLELSLRRYTQALEHAKRVALDDPPGHGTRILPDLVEAAVRTGDDALAEQSLEEFTLRATVAATPWAKGVLARTRALALGTSIEAEIYYEESLRLLNTTTLNTETARTQLLYGEWLRRRKRRADARNQLNASLTEFTDMGASAFAQRAALELAATGLKPIVRSTNNPSELTRQERRVAEHAAQGMTNSEISELMFISSSTVDYHLTKVLRKLQVTSRRKIREKLDGQ